MHGGVMYFRLAIAGVIAVVLTGTGWKCYVMGKQTVQAAWDAEKAASAIAAAKSERKQQQTADSVARTVHQAAHRERVVYRTLLKDAADVPNDCPIPAAVGLLHDAAATATEVPDRGSAGTDGASPTAQDLTETVIENYEACRDSIRRLEALQGLIRAYNGD